MWDIFPIRLVYAELGREKALNSQLTNLSLSTFRGSYPHISPFYPQIYTSSIGAFRSNPLF